MSSCDVPGAVPRLREWLSGASWGLALCCCRSLSRCGSHAARRSFPSTHALVDDWYNHAVYAPFPARLCARRYAGAVGDAERLRWTHSVSPCSAGSFCASGTDSIARPRASLVVLRQSGSSSSAEIWLAIVAVLGFARRTWSRQRGAALSHDCGFSRLHPSSDGDCHLRARAATGSARPVLEGVCSCS